MLRTNTLQYHSDLSKMEELYNATVTHCKEVNGKGVVFVVGKTGSGKSTTINCLTDIPLKKTINPETDDVQIVADVKDSKHVPKIAVIGHEGSQTTFPELFAPKSIHNFYYCDLAGFGDTRGDAYDANAYLSAQIVAQTAAEIKGVICVIEYTNLTAARGLGFIELARLIQEIFLPGSFKRYCHDCVKFVVTKVPDRIKQEHILAKIRQIAASIKTEAKETEDSSYEIFDEILRRPDNLILIRPEDLINSPQKIRDEINHFFNTPSATILRHHVSFLQRSSIESLRKIFNGAATDFQHLLILHEEARKKVTAGEQAVKRLESIVTEEKLAKNKLLDIIKQNAKMFDIQHQLKTKEQKFCAKKINELRNNTKDKISKNRSHFNQMMVQKISEYQTIVNVDHQKQYDLIERLIAELENKIAIYKASNPEVGNVDPVIQIYRDAIEYCKNEKQMVITIHMNTAITEIEKIKQQINVEILVMEKYETTSMEDQISCINKHILKLDSSKSELISEKENHLKKSQEEKEAQIRKLDALQTNLDVELKSLEAARSNLKLIEEDCRSREHDFEILAKFYDRFSLDYEELKKFILIYHNYQSTKNVPSVYASLSIKRAFFLGAIGFFTCGGLGAAIGVVGGGISKPAIESIKTSSCCRKSHRV